MPEEKEQKEREVPKAITKEWLGRRLLEVAPHLGLHETDQGVKGYWIIKKGISQSFTAVGSTWREVGQALNIVPKE